MTEHASAVARATQLARDPRNERFRFIAVSRESAAQIAFSPKSQETRGGLNLARRFLLQKGLATEAVEIHFGDQIRVKLVMHRL